MFAECVSRMAIYLAETGMVPDTWVRRGIRSKLRRRLSESSCEAESFEALLDRCRKAPVAPMPERANDQHYELPVEFFAELLGPRRKYSCCLFPDPTTTLAEAEEHALRETCVRAEIEDGMSLLELGCGWGSLTLWLAERYPNSSIHAVSNSRAQVAWIENEARRRGIDRNLKLTTADMNDFDARGKFDRVVSVEMFEHMRNYAELFRRIASWLQPEGKLWVHVFCHRQRAYEFHAKGPDDWMARYFFTGGIMPNERLLSCFSDALRVEAQWRWNGEHYRRTAEAWLKNFDQRQERIAAILTRAYGANQARCWQARWRLFLLAVAETFGYQAGTEWFVAQYRFVHTAVQAEAAAEVSASVQEDRHVKEA